MFFVFIGLVDSTSNSFLIVVIHQNTASQLHVHVPFSKGGKTGTLGNHWNAF